MKRQPLKEYISSVKKIQWVICAVPLIGWVLPGHWEYLFPTVGSDSARMFCLTSTTFVAGIAVLLPWASDTSKTKRSILLLCVFLFFLSIAAQFYLNQKYVISIPIHGTERTVSIGSERTKIANAYVRDECPECTDADLVMQVGPYENEIRKLWTERSIIRVRGEILASYAAMLFLLNFIVGMLARKDQDGWSHSPRNS